MRLLVAEDQSMLRDALCQLLSMQTDVEEVFQAENGKMEQKILEQEVIDVAILDIEMPDMSGLDVLEWTKKTFPEKKVIIVTTFKRPGYFERAIKAKVDAYVLKERSVVELMKTIHTVLAGKKEYSPELMEAIFLRPNPLTTQERKLLAAVARGYSNHEIAAQFFLSHGTVRNYLSTILSKLGAENRLEATRIAQENGWI